MELKYVLFEARDKIATLTLNQPATMNGYHEGMLREMKWAVEQFRNDDEQRVLVITGTGKAFCAGGDISGRPESRSHYQGHPMGFLLEMREGFHQLVLALTRLDKPVIAAINGTAVAGGLTLALCCDFRIASEQARLGDTALKFALLPDEGGAFFFPRFMGLDKALRMTMLSEVYSAREAEKLGLVTEVVPHDQLDARVADFARRLAAGPPLAQRCAKRMMYKQLEMTLANALEDAALNVMIANGREDVREGAAAFRDKRPPAFKGR